MKIYYFPNKHGKVYLAPTGHNHILMDTIVVDTEGLTDLLEERCGLYTKEETFNRRLCEWYAVMKPWLEKNTGNILYESFKLNPLALAKEMLKWRDQLKMVGWDFVYKDEKTRLGALAAVEKKFHYPGLPDRLWNLISEVKTTKVPFSGVEILLPYEPDLLPVVLNNLLSALKDKGAKVSVIERAKTEEPNLLKIREILKETDNKQQVTLDPQDTSFRILKFKTRKEEEEYFAYKPGEKETLWIIEKNKTFDNRLEASGQNSSGSKTVTGSRITDLLPLLLSIYVKTPDIRNIYNWLSSPYNPLPARFRRKLAETMASKGGYINPECLGLTEKYIEGEFNTDKTEDTHDGHSAPPTREEIKEKKERENKLRLFLPYLYNLHSLSDINQGLSALSTWAVQRVNYITDAEEKENLAPQFEALADAVTNLQLLILADDSSEIDAETLLKWCPEVIPEITLTQYHAKVGSRQVINYPGDIGAAVKNLIWMGIEEMEAPHPECDFLFPGERARIRNEAKFIDPAKENKVRDILQTLPFYMAEKSVTLSYAGKNKGADITLHPLILRLGSCIKNIKDFETEVSILEMKDIEVEKVDNKEFKPEFKIDDTANISWPEKMSASSIESLVFNPLDFFFDKILRLRSTGLNNLPSLEKTKGMVAHYVIAHIFSDRDLSKESYRDVLSREFDQVLMEGVKDSGALMLLPENNIDFKLFGLQLQDSVESLINIIEGNDLEVVACEKTYSKNVGIAQGNSEGNDLEGIIDMHLKDRNGNHVVFDFKWSHGSHYRKLLDKDRSIQLAVYAHLLKENEGQVPPTAYFFMPGNELVTRHPGFSGSNVVYIETASCGNMFNKILNSIRYRKEQIESGLLEGYDGGNLDDLKYYADMEIRELLPLLEDEAAKYLNKYSNYKIFKGI